MSILAKDCELCRAFALLEEQDEYCECVSIPSNGAPQPSRDTPHNAGTLPLAGAPVPHHLRSEVAQ